MEGTSSRYLPYSYGTGIDVLLSNGFTIEFSSLEVQAIPLGTLSPNEHSSHRQVVDT